MSFGVRRPGQPIEPGNAAEFHGGAASGAVLTTGGFQQGPVLAGMGENMIARADSIRRQGPERVMAGAPKFWKVTNRAKQGHVQVWTGVFNGETFPDGADPEDKHTWLQPGQSMMLPLDAALHFFGNVFDPRAPEAIEIIERCGGFELETQRANPGRNAEVRVIGGPIGLPDFVIAPIDGRLKEVGAPIELYSHYWNAVKKRVLKGRKDRDPEVMENEKLLLAERIREYTLDEDPEEGAIYDGNGRTLSTAASRAEDDEDEDDTIPNMRAQFDTNDFTELSEEDYKALSPGNKRKYRAAKAAAEEAAAAAT